MAGDDDDAGFREVGEAGRIDFDGVGAGWDSFEEISSVTAGLNVKDGGTLRESDCCRGDESATGIDDPAAQRSGGLGNGGWVRCEECEGGRECEQKTQQVFGHRTAKTREEIHGGEHPSCEWSCGFYWCNE